MQIFNEFNARKPDEKNIFRGITKNRLFMGIVAVTLVLQVRLFRLPLFLLGLHICCIVLYFVFMCRYLSFSFLGSSHQLPGLIGSTGLFPSSLASSGYLSILFYNNICIEIIFPKFIPRFVLTKISVPQLLILQSAINKSIRFLL